MIASVNTKYGPPDVLQLKEVQKPIPGKNELLIKVYATTVNRTDCAALRAKPFIARFFSGLFKPKKSILGTEFAGKIEAVGNDVSAFKVGEKVFGFDDTGLGSHAEYIILSADNSLTKMPAEISYEQAAASFEGAHYAINFINKVELKKGQRVLVNGATGGIGSAMIQILHYYGADITAVCSTKNIELVKSLGAKKVFDYTREDFTKSREKFHFVFDAVGKSTFSKCKPLLETGGVYISSELGPHAQNIFLPLTTALIRKLPGKRSGKRVIFPMPLDRPKSVSFIKTLIEEGRFKAVIDRKYPLEKIAEAFRYVETGEKIGNVVITVAKEL